MNLQIDDSKTIRDLQERFSLSFPGFRIELCNKPHHWEEVCDRSEKIIIPVYLKSGRRKK